MKIGELIKSVWQKLGGVNRVDYVCGDGEALPLPLSPEREFSALCEMQSEERFEREKAKEELIKHNLRLVVYIARKFDNTGVDNDDLISIGTIGLIKAINSFKVDKNIKLATYASRCIENEILMYLRKTARLKSEISFEEPLNTDFEGKILDNCERAFKRNSGGLVMSKAISQIPLITALGVALCTFRLSIYSRKYFLHLSSFNSL